ncbi:hypothetical protein ACFQ3F_22000 [Nocardioides ginsengisoli]|uniref:Uncharacterized protein n=1 Tax=Nocardioides ginsengisoli TaxID=363868 RepID=A0ABW3W5Y0_9ACTN
MQPDVSALAINVTVPEELRWTDVRRGEEFRLGTLNVRLLPDGRLAATARPPPGDRWRAGGAPTCRSRCPSGPRSRR